MSEVNIPLLRKAVEWVEAQDALPLDDREWDQESWLAFLVPSKTNDGATDFIDPVTSRGVDSGYLGWTDEELQIAVDRGECKTACCVAGWIGLQTSDDYKYTWDPEGKPSVAEYAMRQLGLTDDQAHALFDGCNTAEDIRRVAEDIAGQRL